MEKKLKRQIAKAAENVKRKVQKMRDIETENNTVLQSVFKPVTDSLNQMIDSKNRLKALPNSEVKFEASSPVDKDKTLKKKESNAALDELTSENSNNSEEYDDNTEPLENYYTDEGNNDSFKTIKSASSDPSFDISSWSKSSEALVDVPFGVRNEGGKLMMGSALVAVSGEYIRIGRDQFKRTLGINELLFQKEPDLSLITSDDMANYKLMLLETNVHRRDYDSEKPIRSNRGQKYMKIIKPLFQMRKLSSSTGSSQPDLYQGKGLPTMKKWKKNVDYVYWDDPNELIDRLKLLIASREAGNTGLDNEIISVIEELRESGIIP